MSPLPLACMVAGPSASLLGRLGRAVGLQCELRAGLHEFIEGQGVTHHDLVFDHLGVVGGKGRALRPAARSAACPAPH